MSTIMIVKRNPLFGETESWRHGVYVDAVNIFAPKQHESQPEGK